MKNILTILSVIITNIYIINAQSLIWYSFNINQSIILYEYFNDYDNGFYVDVGAYHPVIVSNTLKLKTQNWKGINVDGSYNKVKLFFTQRKDDLNLNYAIGPQPDTFINFYEYSGDTLMSTIDPKVKAQRLNKASSKTLKVVTISLAQLCHRFYLKRPQFMNLDVQGVGQYAILQNDWKNIKCRPQILMVQINLSTKIAGLQQTQKLLINLGYHKIRQVGQNTVFIDSDVYQKYTKIAQINKQKYQKLKIQSYGQLYLLFSEYKLHIKYPLFFHVQYDNTIHQLYLYFALKGQDLNIQKIRKQSNRLLLINNKLNLIDRPIIIYQFNARDNYILVQQQFTCQEIITTGNKMYYLLKSINGKLQVYIYNMGYLQQTQLPKIINIKGQRKVKNRRSPIMVVNSSISQIDFSSYFQQLEISNNKMQQIISQSIKNQEMSKLVDLKTQQVKKNISQQLSIITNIIQQENNILNKKSKSDIDKDQDFIIKILIFGLIILILLLFLSCHLAIAIDKIANNKKINQEIDRVEESQQSMQKQRSP